MYFGMFCKTQAYMLFWVVIYGNALIHESNVFLNVWGNPKFHISVKIQQLHKEYFL